MERGFAHVPSLAAPLLAPNLLPAGTPSGAPADAALMVKWVWWQDFFVQILLFCLFLLVVFALYVFYWYFQHDSPLLQKNHERLQHAVQHAASFGPTSSSLQDMEV